MPLVLLCLGDIPLCAEITLARNEPLERVLLPKVRMQRKSYVGRLNTSSLLSKRLLDGLGLIRCQALVQVFHQV